MRSIAIDRRGVCRFAGGLILGLLFVMFAMRPNVCGAQGITTGSANGRVLDPNGSAAASSVVTLSNNATYVRIERRTTSNGSFVFSNLPAGSYTLEVHMAGFETVRVPNVVIQAGEAAAVGVVRLTLGTTESVVVDSATSTALRNEAQSSTTFSAAMLQDLPLLGEFDKLADLIPGTVATRLQNYSVPAYIASLESSNFSVNGRSLRSNNFQIDGQSNNDNTVGGQQINVSNEDVLQEVQVVTSNYRSDYGHGTGAIINFVTQAGTNIFHGSGFEFYTGSWLSSLQNDQKNPVLGYCAVGQTPAANGCKAPIVPRVVTNEFGGTLGGPILKNKLWGFGGTYWLHTRTGDTLSTSAPAVTPTPAGLATMQLLAPTNPAVISLTQYGPYAVSTGTPRPVGKKFLAPITINGVRRSIEFSPVGRTLATQNDDQQDVGRLDWQPTGSDHLFTRYIYESLRESPGGGSIASGSWVDLASISHSVIGDWTHTLSPDLVNQLRYGFQQTKLDLEQGAFPACTVVDPSLCPSQMVIRGNVLGSSVAGYGYENYYPQGRTMKINQIQDNLTHTEGRHTMQMGGEFDYQNSPNSTLPYYDGTFTFTNFNEFMVGVGTLRLGDGNFVTPLTEIDAAGYFTDDFRVKPNLTLTLGLRWEFFQNPVNRLHDETMEREQGPGAFWSTSLPLTARTFPEINQYYKNFEPRIGFAWSPERFGGGMIVRGGYSVGVDPTLYAIYLDAATSAPVVNLGSITCTGGCLPASGTGGAAVRSQNLASLPRGGNPNYRDQTVVDKGFRQPYTQFYTLGIEYKIGRSMTASAGYVGDHTVGAEQSLNANPLLAPVAAAFPSFPVPKLCTTTGAAGNLRPDCSQFVVRTRANTAFSIYNSLVLGLTTESFHGVTGVASYTFSRTIDNASEIFSTGIGGNTDAYSQNPLDTNLAERGVSGYSYPHIVSAGIDWDLPIFHDQGTKWGRWLEGWSLDGIFTGHSGQSFSPFQRVTSSINTSAIPDTSFCDSVFDNAYNTISTGAISSCRPVLSNTQSPMKSAAVLVSAAQAANLTAQGTPGYYLYNATDRDPRSPTVGKLNQPVDPSTVRWIWNNKNEALSIGNPFPGVARNTLRGDTFLNLDVSLYKQIPVTEHWTIELRATAQNILNHQYIQIPDNNIDDSNPLATVNPYMSTAYLTSNNRTVQIGAKIIF